MLLFGSSISTLGRFHVCAFAVGFVVGVGCRQNSVNRKHDASIRIEVKLVVPSDRVTSAVESLRLAEMPFFKEEIIFFDTPDCALFAKGLILRARSKAGGKGESTAKLREVTEPTALTEAEEQIKPEMDWTDDSRPAISRSVNNSKLPKGLVEQAAQNGVAIKAVFNAAQQASVEAHVKNFQWENLRRYGPVEAEVWKKNIRLNGFADAVTVEHWHLRKPDAKLDVLEVSAAAKTSDEKEARTWVKAFYAAAADAGLGRPAGLSKTRIVLDFFKPGN